MNHPVDLVGGLVSGLQADHAALLEGSMLPWSLRTPRPGQRQSSLQPRIGDSIDNDLDAA